MKKINFDFTKETIDLINGLTSRDAEVANQSQVAIAAVISKVAEQILPQKLTTGLIYRDFEFDINEGMLFPLDLFADQGEDTIRVWSQVTGGGLPTNQIVGTGSLPFTTYTVDSALSIKKKVIKGAGPAIISRGIERMVAEVNAKREDYGWAVILSALATGKNPDGLGKLVNANTAGVFQVDDFNKALIKLSDGYRAWNRTSPAGTNFGLTDLFLSPKMFGEIRSWSYQPMNTRGVPNTDESTAMPLPDEVRTQILKSFSGQVPNIFGVNFHQLSEFGVDGRYSKLFSNFYGASTPTFNPSSNELIFGIDNTKEAFIRAYGVDKDAGLDIDASGEFIVQVDDQFRKREETLGWYGKLEEARFGIEKRNVVGIIV